MNVLIIHAHENKSSFCSALANTAKETLESSGIKVQISDLYAMNFNPVGSKADFTSLSNSDHYKYASEQLYAARNNGFTPELEVEMDNLVNADILNFNFPLWWWSMPAILKGWIDRIMAYGVAYGGEYGFGEKGRFAGKKAFITTTTGSQKAAYEEGGHNSKSIESILNNIHAGTFQLVGFQVIEPFIAYGVSRISHQERIDIIKRYKDFISSLI